MTGVELERGLVRNAACTRFSRRTSILSSRICKRRKKLSIFSSGCNGSALLVWVNLVRALSEEDLDLLIEPTMSVIAQYWSRLSTDSQIKAHDLVQELFKEKSAVIKEHIDTFPSLAGLPLLSKFEGEISRRKAALDPGRQFDAFARLYDNFNCSSVLLDLEV